MTRDAGAPDGSVVISLTIFGPSDLASFLPEAPSPEPALDKSLPQLTRLVTTVIDVPQGDLRVPEPQEVKVPRPRLQEQGGEG